MSSTIKLSPAIANLLDQVRGSGVGAVLARGTASAFAIRVASSGLAFAVQIVLARLLGAEDFGIYVYAITWITFLALPAQMGFHTATIRFVSEYHGLRQWGLLRGYLRRSQQFTLVASLLIAALIVISVEAMRSRLGNQLTTAFEVACLLIPALTPLYIHAAALRGLKKIILSQTPQEILRPVLLVAGAGVLFLSNSGSPGAPTVLAINLAATLAALALTWTALRYCLPAEAHSEPPRHRSREWLRVALPLSLITGFALVLSDIDIVMVGALIDPRQAGIYAAASRISTLLSFGLIAVGSIAAPMMGELHAQGRRRELQRVLTLGARAALAFAFPMSLLLVGGGQFLLGLFGPDFIQAYPSLLILTATQLALTLSGSVAFLMVMTGDQNLAARIFAFSAALAVALNVLLVPLFGIIGAAIASALANTSCRLLMVRHVVRNRGLNPTALRTTSRG